MSQEAGGSRLAHGAPNDTEIAAQVGPPSESAHEQREGEAEAGRKPLANDGHPSVRDEEAVGAELERPAGRGD